MYFEKALILVLIFTFVGLFSYIGRLRGERYDDRKKISGLRYHMAQLRQTVEQLQLANELRCRCKGGDDV